ncbi:MAG: hypothetical protein Ct9H300mP14_02440 [Gammaproteobacteria bacterium]|nr:MAG: hypothetical protein Ct9H300mP14_02440 [Gammaproteobacteria bacterium]
MIGASVLMHFGEPFILLIGLGYGLGRFIGEMAGIPYFAFLASGFIAWSGMNVASMEAMWSVYTRMVPQQTYEAILATPTRVDDIVIGECSGVPAKAWSVVRRSWSWPLYWVPLLTGGPYWLSRNFPDRILFFNTRAHYDRAGERV